MNSLLKIFFILFSFVQTVYCQDIFTAKDSFGLGEIITIKVIPNNKIKTDQPATIIDLRKTKNLMYERDTSFFEQYADIEVIKN